MRGGRWQSAYGDFRKGSSPNLASPYSSPHYPVLYAKLKTEKGTGDYTWELGTDPSIATTPTGPQGGDCREVNKSTGVTLNKYVLLVRIAGRWYFQASSTGGGGGTDGLWGDASDSDITLDGTTAAFIQETSAPGYAITQLGAFAGTYGGSDPAHTGQNAGNYTNGVKTYNMWRAMFFHHLHLAAGVKLFTQGYPLFAWIVTSDDNTAEITMSVPVWAAMPVDGFNGIDGSCSPGGNGGVGGNGSQAAQATTVRVPFASQTGLQTGSYASAGAGGNSGSHTGGASRSALGSAGLNGVRAWGALVRSNQGITFGASNSGGLGSATWAGGQGGSGGASDSGGGGAGGKSGGTVLANVQDLSGYKGKFSAKGGDGTTPANDGRSAGGGAAGSGGFLSINTDTVKTPSKVWDTSDIGPGTPGSGVGTGGTSGGTSSSGLSTGTYP